MNRDTMAKRGCTLFNYDPFNRSSSENKRALSETRLDFITCNNVLNVIDDDDAMIEAVLRIAEKCWKNNALAIFSVYKGDGSGVGKVTPRGYQRNCSLKWYYDVIEKLGCFEKIVIKNDMIICSIRAS